MLVGDTHLAAAHSEDVLMSIKMADYRQEETAVWPHRSLMGDEGERGRWNKSSHVIYTVHGIAAASRYFDQKHQSTWIDFVWNGRCHTRIWNKAWADRTITRLARVMVEEIVNQ